MSLSTDVGDILVYLCLLSLSASVRGFLSSFYHAGGGRPSKHETLTQCWANVGFSSTTLSQRKPTIDPAMCRCNVY